jgi:hypothetical protein
VFSIGDVAATGGNKAAAPGYAQAGIATQNIVNMIAGRSERVEYVPAVPGIHLAIGLVRRVFFASQRDSTDTDIADTAFVRDVLRSSGTGARTSFSIYRVGGWGLGGGQALV